MDIMLVNTYYSPEIIGGAEISHAVLGDNPVQRDLEQGADHLHQNNGHGQNQGAVQKALAAALLFCGAHRPGPLLISHLVTLLF